MSIFGALVARPDLATVNEDLSSAKDTTMISELGSPSVGLTAAECRNPLASDNVRALLETRNFGKFEVTGIAPALDSLQEIMDTVHAQNAPLFEAVGSVGMLCVRLRRPTSGAPSNLPSNHSWGTAIDITIDGVADTVADGRVQQGIVDLIPFFNDAGWFWGGGFSSEDDTHFEVADETITDWSGGGKFLVTPPTPPPAGSVPAGPVSEAQGRQFLIAAMNAQNLRDNTSRRGIAAIAAVESGFVPKSETGYGHTSNDRIRDVFRSRVAGLDDNALTRLKGSDEDFFNLVYGGTFGSRNLGNTAPGDGFKYRGRGLFQLTGRSNYERYGGMIQADLLSSPDLANDGATAARVAVVYMQDRLRGTGFAAMKAAVGNSSPDISARKDARFAEFGQSREFDAT